MNIVYEYGSTGRLIKELMNAAKNEGHEVLCAYGRYEQAPSDDTFYFGSKIQSAYHLLMTRLFGGHGLHSSLATRKLIKRIEDFNPEVIHLHNLHGYYLNVPMLMQYIKTKDVKVVWSLHDAWCISGSTAHFDYYGCKEWDEGCVICNETRSYPEAILFPNQRRNFKWKKDSFTGLKNAHIILASNWLTDIMKQTFFKEYPISLIYNGIDLETFSPLYKKAPKDKIKLLGVANDWNDKKGYPDFMELSSRLSNKYELTLIGLSGKQLTQLPQNIKGIKRTSSLEELVNYYQESDIYLNLSVEETMGMTTVEAMACGTPCIVYDRTAVPEIIDETSGVVVKTNDVDALHTAIETFDYGKYTGENARKRAEFFSKDKMFEAYLKEYK